MWTCQRWGSTIHFLNFGTLWGQPIERPDTDPHLAGEVSSEVQSGIYRRAACETATATGACQRLLDRCPRNLVSFLFLVPIPGFSQKISRQEAARATIASSPDAQHPGFCELHFMRAAC